MADNNGTNKAMAPSLLMPLSVTSVSQRGVGRGAQLLLTKIVHQQLRHVAKLHHLCASFEFSLELASLSPITPSPSISLSSSATIFVNIVVVSRRLPRRCHRCPHRRRRAIVAPFCHHHRRRILSRRCPLRRRRHHRRRRHCSRHRCCCPSRHRHHR